MEYIINVNPKEASLLEDFLNKMKIRFTKIAEETSVVAEDCPPYNEEFVEKIYESERQIKEGKYTTMTMDELKDYLGI